MVMFVCECGMHFQVTEEQLVKRRYQNCPNCDCKIPQDFVNSAVDLIETNAKYDNFKTFVIENKDIKGTITGSITL
jgi:DNA-directed RNA polymerase subunit RPC12/RpoP